MTAGKRSTLFVGTLAAFLTLSACKSDEEQVAEYYASAMELLAAGDTERAKVELRNATQIDQFDVDSRRALAGIAVQEGSLDVAYRNYLYVIEKAPDTPDVRLTLAEIALELGELDEARRQGEAAIALVPDDPRAKVLQAVFDYQDALESDDADGQKTASDKARQLMAELPDDTIARRVVIDSMLQGDDPQDAMPEVEQALERQPESYLYNKVKLQLLVSAPEQDAAAIGDQLRKMVKLFPEDEQLSIDLTRYYLNQNDLAGAESFLRELAADEASGTSGNLTLVQFLEQTQGPDAARAELERLAADNVDAVDGPLYQSLAAVYQFNAGDQDGAIAKLESLVATNGATEQDLRIKATLARLLLQTGNTVGARARVEEILEVDSSNVDALKMRAAWDIQDDNPTDAIASLRTALNQSPRDPDILTLMAEAYERDGNRTLAGERLAQAVEVTNTRSAEALRYFRFLMTEGRTAPAMSVLADARSANPGDVEVLATLGEQLLQQESWTQVRRVVDDLVEIGTIDATRIAQNLSAASLAGQGRVDESVAFLETQIGSGDTNAQTVLQLVQLALRSDNPSEARRLLDDALAKNPDELALRLMDARLLMQNSADPARIESILRDVIAENPDQEAPVRMLYSFLLTQNRASDASSVLLAGLERQPENAILLWTRASELENQGDIDGALAIYADIYARDTSNTVIANNLASLLATHKDDVESLERAAVIARRLRDLNVPQYQDTYGWIMYRQGNLEEAEPNLMQAAENLPTDPLVQYHLGMVQAKLGKTEAARATLMNALEIAGDSPLPQFDEARSTLESLGEVGAAEEAVDTPQVDGNP